MKGINIKDRNYVLFSGTRSAGKTEEEYSHIAYFRLDGGSSKLYTQEYVDKKDKEIERLNNIINELEKLELYEFTPDYDYDENLIEGYTPFNIGEYIQELKGVDKE